MPSIPQKYAKLFLDEKLIRKKITAGTMPAEMKVLLQVLTEKLGDKKLMQSLVNECLKTGQVTVKM